MGRRSSEGSKSSPSDHNQPQRRELLDPSDDLLPIEYQLILQDVHIPIIFTTDMPFAVY